MSSADELPSERLPEDGEPEVPAGREGERVSGGDVESGRETTSGRVERLDIPDPDVPDREPVAPPPVPRRRPAPAAPPAASAEETSNTSVIARVVDSPRLPTVGNTVSGTAAGLSTGSAGVALLTTNTPGLLAYPANLIASGSSLIPVASLAAPAITGAANTVQARRNAAASARRMSETFDEGVDRDAVAKVIQSNAQRNPGEKTELSKTQQKLVTGIGSNMLDANQKNTDAGHHANAMCALKEFYDKLVSAAEAAGTRGFSEEEALVLQSLSTDAGPMKFDPAKGAKVAEALGRTLCHSNLEKNKGQMRNALIATASMGVPVAMVTGAVLSAPVVLAAIGATVGYFYYNRRKSNIGAVEGGFGEHPTDPFNAQSDKERRGGVVRQAGRGLLWLSRGPAAALGAITGFSRRKVGAAYESNIAGPNRTLRSKAMHADTEVTPDTIQETAQRVATCKSDRKEKMRAKEQGEDDLRTAQSDRSDCEAKYPKDLDKEVASAVKTESDLVGSIKEVDIGLDEDGLSQKKKIKLTQKRKKLETRLATLRLRLTTLREAETKRNEERETFVQPAADARQAIKEAREAIAIIDRDQEDAEELLRAMKQAVEEHAKSVALAGNTAGARITETGKELGYYTGTMAATGTVIGGGVFVATATLLSLPGWAAAILGVGAAVMSMRAAHLIYNNARSKFIKKK